MKRKLFAVLALMLALMLAFGNVTVLASSQANGNLRKPPF